MLAGVSRAPAYGAPSDRPPRVRVLTLDPAKNAPKPLADYDPAGWAYFEDVIVGQVGQRWLGGRSWSKGRFLWWTEIQHPLSCPITAVGSAAIACLRDGTVIKFNPFDGKVLWTARLDSFVNKAPAVQGATVFFLTARQKVYALDLNAGTTKWFYDAGLPEGLTIADSNPPLVHGRELVFGLANGKIQAVDAETGSATWNAVVDSKQARFSDIVGALLIYEELLIAARYDGVIAGMSISGKNRTVVWRQELAGIGATAFRNGRLYVGTVAGDVFAYDATSGKQIWVGSTGEAIKTIVVLESAIFVGGSRGRVTRLDAETGKIDWHDDLLSSLSDRPILIDDEIFFATGMGNLYGYKVGR